MIVKNVKNISEIEELYEPAWIIRGHISLIAKEYAPRKYAGVYDYLDDEGQCKLL